MDAVQILGQLNDPTAVPALIKALERYNRDVPFAILVTRILSRLGDARALSALRPLTTGRDYRLMQAAREATQIIEARIVLLRPSHEPTPQEIVLLRATRTEVHIEPELLLRAGETPA
jgi:HEAT repeat protein